jgi:hypothetical protein
MKRHLYVPTLALLLCAPVLQAQQAPGWKVGGAVDVALPALTQWTNNSLAGITVDGGYQFAIPDTSAFVRPGLSLGFFPGKALDNGRKTSLQNAQILADLVVPVKGPLAFITGVTLNAWRQNTTGTWTTTYADQDAPVAYEGKSTSTVHRPFGKFGFRLGFEYTVSEKLAVTAILQQAELGTDNEFVKDGYEYNGGTLVNPSWVQVGVRYSF